MSSDDVQKIISDIHALENKIKESETEIANIDGRIENVMDVLKDKHNISTYKELKNEIKKKKEFIENLEAKIIEKYEKIKELEKKNNDVE